MKYGNPMKTFGTIILAAGESVRLGKPKQLLAFKGNTFLRNAVNTALDADSGATVVVLGAAALQLQKHISEMPVDIVINEQYKEGMASSIKTGLQFMLKNYPQTDGVLIMVCDQPYVSSSHIRKLAEVQKTHGTAIVASLYNNIQGVPAIFHKNIFPELLQLNGDKGARQIIMRHDERESVPFLFGNIDIDTKEDYKALNAIV